MSDVDNVGVVCREAAILGGLNRSKLADCGSNQAGEVALDMGRVFPGQFDLTRETEIVADKDIVAARKAGRKRHVMRVPQADDRTVI